MLGWAQFNHAHYLAQFVEEKAREGFNVFLHPFNAAIDFTPLTALTTDSRSLDVDNDADLILFQASINDLFTDLRVRIRLESTARELQNIPVEAANIFGTGQEPFYYYAPIFLPRRTSMTIQAENSRGADVNIRMNFHGVKAFYTSIPAAAA